MRKYDSYKDSGIEWIGEIPSHWKAVPMRFLLRQRITDGPHETPKFLPDGIPFLSVDGIQDGELVFEGCRKISEEDHERYKQKCVVEKHDILMGKAASVGKVAQVKVDFEFSIWSPLALLKPNHEKITSSYFEYFLKSTYAKDNANILSTFNTQQNISMTDIPRIYYIIPNSVEEQTAIAAYLDRKTAEIDELIADKKRLLELYEEEKTAIINQAVTKGINPDVPMKDSGIEWLGKIPEHWEVSLLKRFCKVTDGSHYSPKTQEIGLPYVSVKDVGENSIDLINCKKISVEDFDALTKNGCKPKDGDILLTKDGTIGRAAIVTSEHDPFVILSSLGLITPNEKLIAKYLYYYLISGLNIDQMYSFIHGSALTRLTIEKINNLIITIPPTIEQSEIVNQIELKCSVVNAKKSKTEKLIELLTEYRTALISEVVTGKVKVID